MNKLNQYRDENVNGQWSRPVRRLFYLLKYKGFIPCQHGSESSNRFMMERPFVCRETGEEYLFDFALFGRKKNVYIELDDPGHKRLWRALRDCRKEAAANRVKVPVLRFTYDEMDHMTNAQLWRRVAAALV